MVFKPVELGTHSHDPVESRGFLRPAEVMATAHCLCRPQNGHLGKKETSRFCLKLGDVFMALFGILKPQLGPGDQGLPWAVPAVFQIGRC